MPNRLPHLVRVRHRIEAVDARSCRSSGASSVVSIWMVVVLPAPFGPRNAKISPACDVERHAVDGLDVAEGLDQVMNMNHACAPVGQGATLTAAMRIRQGSRPPRAWRLILNGDRDLAAGGVAGRWIARWRDQFGRQTVGEDPV